MRVGCEPAIAVPVPTICDDAHAAAHGRNVLLVLQVAMYLARPRTGKPGSSSTSRRHRITGTSRSPPAGSCSDAVRIAPPPQRSTAILSPPPLLGQRHALIFVCIFFCSCRQPWRCWFAGTGQFALEGPGRRRGSCEPGDQFIVVAHRPSNCPPAGSASTSSACRSHGLVSGSGRRGRRHAGSAFAALPVATGRGLERRRVPRSS